eukprot:TRINITY_DN1909_c0_g1_i2.p1 TRINITY_DN1909_c0_g1~~TRINITY_DN1909_c0_g1_i2.p1  ORF type:complete len:200 (+),score=32.62 TRINITY_DN1909_c0_g1_i2:83-682(+)
MLKFFAIALLLLATSSAWTPPWFCHQIDCPVYTSISNTTNYEIRQYDAAKWTSTDLPDMTYEEAAEDGFFRLFDYISGKNQGNVDINMTAPVRFVAKQDKSKENFTVSFYLPYAWQDKVPPKPTDPTVYTESNDAAKYAVTGFSGWATNEDIDAEVKKLRSYLDSDKVEYNKDFYIFAGYDAPYRIFDRHNEVWLQLVQ